MSSQQDNAHHQQGLDYDPEMAALEREYEEAHASAENAHASAERAREQAEDAKRYEAGIEAILEILRRSRQATEDRV